MHPGESARSGTAHKAEQNGLRLVVAGVAERDEIRAEMPPGTLQELVTGVPRCRFDGLPVGCGASRNVGSIGDDGHARLRGKGGGMLLVAVGRRPELMVEMREPDETPAPREETASEPDYASATVAPQDSEEEE